MKSLVLVRVKRIRNSKSSLKPRNVHPLLVLLSGPSGVGKDATIGKMKEKGLPFHYVVTTTTRPKRTYEKEGIDYHFVSQEAFKRYIASGILLEWAEVYGNYYGVPKGAVKTYLARNKDVILKVDVQGAARIKELVPEAIFIFLMPPSIEELSNRLKKRHGGLNAELDERINTAKHEIESLTMFDYVVVTHNDKLDITAKEIVAIVTAEKCRVKPRVISL